MFRRPRSAILLTGLAPALLCCLAVGCGGGGQAHVSGKVTFQGKPVPAGKIYFAPDGSKGNSGPTGYADIKDGNYDTSSTGGRAATPGPVVITVEGTDPSAAPGKADPSGEVTVKLLFAGYELKAELPSSSSTKDIEVPESAAKGPKPSRPVGIQP